MGILTTKLSREGVTLVELVIVIAILAVLVSVVSFAFNPLTQIEKARNAQRQSDIREIRNALETYYQDKNCFPDENDFTAILASSGEWSENAGRTVYLKKVPVGTGNLAYIYKAQSESCPQWAVIFTKLSIMSEDKNVCPLSHNPTCAPQGFDGTWACIALGSPDCQDLSTRNL